MKDAFRLTSNSLTLWEQTLSRIALLTASTLFKNVLRQLTKYFACKLVYLWQKTKVNPRCCHTRPYAGADLCRGLRVIGSMANVPNSQLLDPRSRLMGLPPKPIYLSLCTYFSLPLFFLLLFLISSIFFIFVFLLSLYNPILFKLCICFLFLFLDIEIFIWMWF